MTQRKNILQMLEEFGGAATASRLVEAGAHPEALRRMAQKGELYMPMRGLYALTSLEFEPMATLAFLSARNPNLIACLKTAAVIHELTTENLIYWDMIGGRDIRTPQLNDNGQVRLVPWKKMVETAEAGIGIGTMSIHGIDVRVTTPERTVCDLLRFRNRHEFCSERLAIEAAVAYITKGGDKTELTRMAEKMGCRAHIDLLLGTIQEAIDNGAAPAAAGRRVP